MLHDESRKYFNRVFAFSGSAFCAYAMRKPNHVQLIQECSQIYDMNKLIDYLKSSKTSTLNACYPWIYPGGLISKWVPTIESPNTKGRFFTKTPDDIYSSGKAPPMDSMFSFTSQVHLLTKRVYFTRINRINAPCFHLYFVGNIAIFPRADK